jgi:hypothetical protein
MFSNGQIATASYISLCHNYLTVTKTYLIHEYFNRIEIQISQYVDIEDLQEIT